MTKMLNWAARFCPVIVLLGIAVGGGALRAQTKPENPFIRYAFDVSWDAHCGRVDDDRYCTFVININGDITSQTAVRFEEALTRWDKRAIFLVSLSSPGGDIAAAMKIGRTIRSLHGHTRVMDKAGCASACVLIYGAGVSRLVFGEGQLGIHRPALAVVPQESDSAAVKAVADRIADALRAYAAEMNIATRLIDDMLVISPDNIRWLTAEDRQNYGLGFLDPVYEETTVLDAARKLGITPGEYRRRQKLAEFECKGDKTWDEANGVLVGVHSDCFSQIISTGKRIQFPNAPQFDRSKPFAVAPASPSADLVPVSPRGGEPWPLPPPGAQLMEPFSTERK
jgi:ATP-dependent protease ClpP protease subunit